ncbi:hypothetical protein ACFPOE_08825 [Caenimonas terrae]|uniref:PXPV repeat-containing protein n=1 Tax=Caenimonas terrae TaxID=696074 RepID=A0ABW0NFE6_9BURK
MNSPIRARFIAAAALALGGLGAMSAAQARSDVSFFVGVQSPVYMEPAPVYVQPQPVYVQPQPVYVQPQQTYVQPRTVYVSPPAYVQDSQPVYYNGYAFERNRRHEEWRRWQWRHRFDRDHHHGRDWD